MTKARRLSLLAAATGGLLILYLGAVYTSAGRTFDQWLLIGLPAAAGPWAGVADDVLGQASPLLTVLALGVLLTVAWLRGRLRAGLRSGLVVVGAVAAAEVLKLALPGRPGEIRQAIAPASTNAGPTAWLDALVNGFTTPGSFPSGHTALVTGLALMVLTVTYPFARIALQATSVIAITATSLLTVTAGWHRPTDAVGGVLVALAVHYAALPSRPRAPLPPAPRSKVAVASRAEAALR